MINELRTKILLELQKIEWVAEIFDGIPKKFGGFPSIFFNFDRVESQSLDSNHNQRQYYFQINCSDLGGLALKIDAVGGDIQSVETESWPTLHAIIVLGIHTDFTLSI